MAVQLDILSVRPTSNPQPKYRDADSPNGRLFAYWRDEVWPTIGEAAYVESRADFVQLSRALRKLSEVDVRKALGRVTSDVFWRGKSLAAVCSSGLNSLLTRPPGPEPSSTGCLTWDQLLDLARANGGRDAVQYLRQSVTPKVRGKELVLEVADEFRAQYVCRHLPGIEAQARERFGVSVKIVIHGTGKP